MDRQKTEQEKRENIKITWMGTATFLLEAAGERILFDPFVPIKGGENPGCIDDFLKEDTIFITHGHFDHLCRVPQLLEEGEGTVFCTAQPARTLEQFTNETDRVVQIRVGDTLPIGDIRIRVLKGAHIAFQMKRIFDTMTPWRVLRYWRNMPFLLWANHVFKDGGETVAFSIQAAGKTILLLGSLALDEQEEYPRQADLLILPYSGNNNLVEEADKIIERLRPRRILLSHFDDAFPPMSRSVDTRELKRMLDRKWPDIQAVKPAYGKRIIL